MFPVEVQISATPAEGSSDASLKIPSEHKLVIPILGIYPIDILSYMRHDIYIASCLIGAKNWKSVSDLLNKTTVHPHRSHRASR